MKRIKEVREIAESVGLTVISVELNGHIKLVCETVEGRRFAYFTGATPGDNRANKNLRADLRRYAMGVKQS
jgi:hypothetical protein